MNYHFFLYHTLQRAREERIPIAHLVRSLKTGVHELPGDADACWRLGREGGAVGDVHLASENLFLKRCLDFLLYQVPSRALQLNCSSPLAHAAAC